MFYIKYIFYFVYYLNDLLIKDFDIVFIIKRPS
jgi:hypothetical protein